MTKITLTRVHSGMRSRAIRHTLSALAVVTSCAGLLPSVVQAQTYVGNAYTARAGVDVSLINLGVGVNTQLFNTGNLNPTTQQTLNGLTLGVGTGAGLNLNVATNPVTALLGVGDILDATASTTFTTSLTPTAPFNAVYSTARIVDLNLVNTLGGIAGSTILGALVSADVVQSETGAFLSGLESGSTTITNLRINGSANLTLNGQAATLLADANGKVTVANQKFDILSVLGGTLKIGTLTINEQIVNGDGSLTTNALRLQLLDTNTGLSGLLNNLAGADVIVSSSTAGFTPAASVAAPEPGTLALLLPLIGGVGLAARKKRRR
ncbi:MAG: PEP-CTERM sorting domain-containing protein [Armatimonadota bacterium]